MPDEAKARELRARLDAIAPLPETGPVTALQLARHLGVRAQERYIRQVQPFGAEFDWMQCALMTAEFAAAGALAGLTGTVHGDETATAIRDAWDDGEGMGEWLWRVILGADTAREVAALAEQLGEAIGPADQVTVSRAESERLSNGARVLGATLTGMSRSMEAARIEMMQNGPAAAMEWILGAVPDVSDAEPGDQWDGKESAREWLERTEARPAGLPS